MTEQQGGISGAPAAAWQAPVEDAGPAPGIQFADHGSRLISYLLDTLIVGFISIVAFVAVTAIVAAAGSVAAGVGLFGLLVIGLLVLWIAYWPWFWVHGGQTPGMMPFRLYVVRDRDGGPVTMGPALLRLLGYWVNGVALYIGFAWVLIDKRRRGWHDLIAGTVVIKR